MKTNTESNSLQKESLEVALLVSDLVQAKKISNVFRQIGIIPHFYEGLRDFWNGILNTKPALTIVDVKLMASDGLKIQEHPLIKKNQVPVSFLYEEGTSPLLISTFKQFHFGLINASLPLKGQVQALLIRLNEYIELKNSLGETQKNLGALEMKVGSLVEGYHEKKESQFFSEYLENICYQFENQLKTKSFHEACESVFNQVAEIKEFGMYELNEKAQKLHAPNLLGGKFHKLPSLWLGQTSQEGIEFFAQNQASQVALDMLGGNIVSLYIYGSRANPEMILYMTSDNEEFLNNMNWKFFEKFMSGLYARKALETANLQQELRKPLLAPWELFGFINEQRLTKGSDDYALIDLDFSILVDVVSNQTNHLFHWKNLYREFVNSLASRSKVEFNVAPVGARNLCFVVKENIADEMFKLLKAFSSKYPYWRYFEDTEDYFTTNLKPRVQMIPFSTKAYVDYIDNFVVEEKLGIHSDSTQIGAFSSKPKSLSGSPAQLQI